MLRFIVGFIYIVFSFSEIKTIWSLFLLTLNKPILIKFQNDHIPYNRPKQAIIQHNTFIEVNRKLIENKKVLWR